MQPKFDKLIFFLLGVSITDVKKNSVTVRMQSIKWNTCSLTRYSHNQCGKIADNIHPVGYKVSSSCRSLQLSNVGPGWYLERVRSQRQDAVKFRRFSSQLWIESLNVTRNDGAYDFPRSYALADQQTRCAGARQCLLDIDRISVDEMIPQHSCIIMRSWEAWPNALWLITSSPANQMASLAWTAREGSNFSSVDQNLWFGRPPNLNWNWFIRVQDSGKK